MPCLISLLSTLFEINHTCVKSIILTRSIRILYNLECFYLRRETATIGPLHDPITWYKITYTGEQIAQWDLQNNAPAFVLEVPLCNLLTSICNFVPCDRVVQRAYYSILLKLRKANNGISVSWNALVLLFHKFCKIPLLLLS